MKMKMLFLYSIFLCGTLLSSSAYAEDDGVHFGTIFIEPLQYENSEESQSINHLTDSSRKQLELETLYKSEVGVPNSKLKKISGANRSPASTAEDDLGLKNKVGVVRNADLPKKIVYFLELRSFEGNLTKPIMQGPGASSPFLIQLQPGELVKVTNTPDQYIHKLRMDRDNQGLWEKISTREQDVQNAHIYYDWRNFETITSHEFPVEMDILVPYGRNSIPVFSRPGAWTWKDCGLSEDLCLDNIDLHTQAYLFDSTIVDVRLSPTQNQDYRLFYKIGYQLKDKNGSVQHKIGWIPARHAKRKVSQLPKSLLATRDPDSFGSFESDEERRQRLLKYYVFKDNVNSDNKFMSRWLASNPGQSTEVFFQNIAWEGIAQVNNFNLTQSFNTKTFNQTGLNLGVGIYAPIYIDLELQGAFMFTAPASSNADEDPLFKEAFLFKGDQWLMYTTPLSISGTPIKFGVGGYYLTMFNSGDLFGFRSLVGFQFKALLENTRWWTGVRYGPTGQDLGFEFSNRELGIDFGYRLFPEQGYNSWSIVGEFSDTQYKSPSDNTTEFTIINLGVRKQF